MPSTPKPGTSIAERFPALAAEWLSERNGDLGPADVTPGSNRRVWWRCNECGHEWATVIARRALSGSGCRRCARAKAAAARAMPKPGRSLADLRPDLAAEWHPTENGDLSPRDVHPATKRRVWWQCANGHEWSVAPADRRRGSGCPTCGLASASVKQTTPKPGRSLADRFPEVAAEWHPTKNAPRTPSDVYACSKTVVWWRCGRCGHEWQTDPDHRVRAGRPATVCKHRRPNHLDTGPAPAR